MKEKDLPIDRTKHKVYTNSAKRCVQTLLRCYYDEETAAVLWEKIQAQYCAFLQDEPALAGLKITTSIYDPILIFAWYAVIPDKPPLEDVQQEIYQSFFGSFDLLGKVFNLNRRFDNRLASRIFQKANDIRVAEIEHFPASFRMGSCAYDKDNEIFRYSFTQCPNAEFAKRHHMEHVLPVLCNCDHLAMQALHAALIREGTCLTADCCDYCIVGDRHPLAAQYELQKAENGLLLSLSQAAMALGISQPALSKVLTEWDSLCASPLFLRYHRRQIPTALGRKVLEYAEKIVDEQNRMMLTMRSVTGREKQNIRVCTAPNRGAIIYSKIYNRFSRRYPDISLRLTELYAREQPHAIRRGQVDLALGAGTDSELVTDIPIVREELLVSLPSSHPLAGQKSIRLRDLRDTPFVLQGKRHSIRAIADGLFAEAGFAPVVSFESDDVILLDSMMHQAVGAGLVSKAHVFPCDELVYLSLDPPVYQRLHLRYPLGHTLTEPERYLAGLLIRERLSDPRYEPIRSPEADTLFAMVEAADEAYIAGSNQTRASGASHQDSGFISLDTKILEYLTAIVEEQSLSRAADRFYLAQPALSRHLRNMEETVGLRLFHREHNRLYPTNAGKVFVNNARNILRMEAELDRVIKDYRRDHGGRLFVHCDSTLLSLFAEVVTPAFSSLYPDIQLTVVESCSGTSREALLSSSTDFALFMTCTPKQTELHCEILGLTELVTIS